MPTLQAAPDSSQCQDVFYMQTMAVGGCPCVFICDDDGQPAIKKTITVTAAAPFKHGTVLGSVDGIAYAPVAAGTTNYLSWAVVDAEPVLLSTDVLPIAKEITIRQSGDLNAHLMVWPAGITPAQILAAQAAMIAANFTVVRGYNV